ncbi:putative laccase [Helianthus anomalus]
MLITQYPIRPEVSYTFWFTILGLEGTLWGHAHSSWIRATVCDIVVLLSITLKKDTPTHSLSHTMNRSLLLMFMMCITINGQHGDLYKCSSKGLLLQNTMNCFLF